MKKPLVILFSALILSALSADGGTKQANFQGLSRTFNAVPCPTDRIKFDDGDSFACNGEEFRVMGVDTPEIRHPDHGIDRSQKYGRRAAVFTKKLLKGAKRILIIKSGADRYGRTTAHVLANGELLSVKLILAGLGYETISRYGDGGFPEFALAIKEASESVPTPPFEDPHNWRKKHQKKGAK